MQHFLSFKMRLIRAKSDQYFKLHPWFPENRAKITRQKFSKIYDIWGKNQNFFQKSKNIFFEIDLELSETHFKPKIPKSILHRGSWR